MSKALAGAVVRAHQGKGPSRAHLKARTIGRIDVLEASGRAVSFATECRARPAALTAYLQLQGSATLQQRDHRVRLEPGDLCLLRGSRPLALAQSDDFRVLLVDLPEHEIADRFPLWRAALLVPLRADSGVPAVFRDAVVSLRRWSNSLGETGSHGVADAIVDLVGAVICCAAPTNSECIRRSLHHRERIKNFARRHLKDPDLNIDLIAEGVGLSARQVHRLFADEQMSLMRWVWVQRLENCHREISQPGEVAPRTISEIAYAWGFNDQAHFSRSFRKHFGVSARSLRQRARAANPH
jgi:AraC-like DNA-binding protein